MEERKLMEEALKIGGKIMRISPSKDEVLNMFKLAKEAEQLEDAYREELKERLNDTVEELNRVMLERKPVYSTHVQNLLNKLFNEDREMAIQVNETCIHISTKKGHITFPFEGKYMILGLGRAGIGEGGVRKLSWECEDGTLSAVMARPPFSENWVALIRKRWYSNERPKKITAKVKEGRPLEVIRGQVDVLISTANTISVWAGTELELEETLGATKTDKKVMLFGKEYEVYSIPEFTFGDKGLITLKNLPAVVFDIKRCFNLAVPSCLFPEVEWTKDEDGNRIITIAYSGILDVRNRLPSKVYSSSFLV